MGIETQTKVTCDKCGITVAVEIIGGDIVFHDSWRCMERFWDGSDRIICSDSCYNVMLDRRVAAQKEYVEIINGEDIVYKFAKAILHGSDEHKAWLLEAAKCFMSDESIPEVVK